MNKKSVFLGIIIAIAGTFAASEQAQAEAETNYQIFLPVITNNYVQVPAELEWLYRVNEYRAQAHLPEVTENGDWSEGAWLHSRYMVKTDTVGHEEEKSSEWFSKQGKLAGESSVVVGSYDASLSDEFMVDAWMQAPFHSVSLLDPRLSTVGYGSYREEDGGYQTGATLDVIRGIGDVPRSVQYPVMWPADGEETSLYYFWGEYPDPLASCSGYTAPTGLPIIVQLGDGSNTPKVTGHSITQDGSEVEHCVFDETSYKNQADSYAQSVGRSILDYRDAVVIIPRYPLTPGASYNVSLTSNGNTYNWSFSVTDSGRAPQIDLSELSQGQADLGLAVLN